VLSSSEAKRAQVPLDCLPVANNLSVFDADDQNFYALVDDQCVLLSINRRLELLLAEPKSAVLGRPLTVVFSQLDNDLSAREAVAQALAGQPVRASLTLIDNTFERHFDITCLPTALADGSTGVLVCGHDVSHHRETERSLRQLAHMDPLTQLPNLRFIDYQLRKLQAQGERDGRGFTVVFIDFDQFKRVNDQHGHLAGDQVLIEFSRRLRGCLRAGEHVGRIGGDEFLVVIREALCENSRLSLTQRLKTTVSEPFDIGEGVDVSMGISVGISVWPSEGSSLAELKQLADARMYADKQQS